jgi:fructose-specific phosphotransferase system IIC component
VGSYCYVSSWPVLKTDATQNQQRGDIYPYQGAPGHAEARVPFLGSQVRRASDGIPFAHAKSDVGGVITWFITAISSFEVGGLLSLILLEVGSSPSMSFVAS